MGYGQGWNIGSILSFTTAASCSYDFSFYSASPGSGASSGSFTVTTGSSCPWSAISDATSWLHTSSGTTGSGTVTYSYDANTSTSPRIGHITAGGQTFTVTQAGITIPALSITTTAFNPPTATVGVGYAAQQAVAATGGTTPYNWVVSGQPNGMNISSVGALFGTPTVSGAFNLNVTVTDSSSPQKTASKVLPLTVTGPTPDLREVIGTVWNDADRNRMLDEGEQPSSGWTVYADLNGNGTRDAGEPSIVTDANGNYKLSGLPTGSVDIRLEMQNQFTQTLPGASGADPGGFLQIQLNYLDNKLSASQKAIVASAVARWQEMLLTSLAVQIEVEVTAIDGAGKRAAQAAPRMFRSTGTPLPSLGRITIDEADLATAESQGWLKNLLLHEMGHIFGIGTIWSRSLLTGAGGADPRFTGPRGTSEYRAIFGTSENSVSVENTGLVGSIGAHWRKSVFGDELMTPSVGSGTPTSRITIGAMHDFGYAVNYLAADAYAKPSGSALVPAGLETGRCDCQAMVLAALGVYDPPQPNARRTAAVGVPNAYRVNLTTPSLHGFHFGVVPSQPSGTLQFTSPIASVSENDGTVVLTVSRTGGSAGVVGVSYATANGTALAGSDYTAVNNTLNWPAGDTASKTFTVSILNNTTPESSESFTVTLTPTGGATLGTPSTATVTITDDDSLPRGTLQFAVGTPSLSESAGSVMLTVTRTGGSSGAVGVSYATANGTGANAAVEPGDYTTKSGTLSWADGDTVAKPIVVTLIGDNILESTETFTVSLSTPTGNATLGAIRTATVTITDDDGPVQQLSVANPNVTVARGGIAVVPVLYNVSNGNNQLSGLNMRVHYNSAKFSSFEVANLLTANSGTHEVDSVLRDDTVSDFDGDPATDKFLLVRFVSIDSRWPGGALPVQIFEVRVGAAAALAEGETTTIRFTVATPTPGFGFSAPAVAVRIQNFSLDIEGDGTVGPFTDGFLALRYLLDYSDVDLVKGNAVAPTGTRRTAAELRAYLVAAGNALDIDGDGTVGPFTDGFLMLRYLLDYSDVDLVKGNAVAPAGTRNTAAAIRSYLAGLRPTGGLPLIPTGILSEAKVTASVRPMAGGAQEQQVVPALANVSLTAGGTGSVDVNYNTSDGNVNLSGLNLRVHYNSAKFSSFEVANLLTANSGTHEVDSVPRDDTVSDFDGDAETDKFLLVRFVNIDSRWPGGVLPVRLFTLNVAGVTGLMGTTRVNFTRQSVLLGYDFSSVAITFAPAAAPTRPVITSLLTASGTVGQAFTYPITANNAPTSFGATGLPVGLSINPATGQITGTPTTGGTINVVITASNAGGTDTQTLVLTVNRLPQTITFGVLPTKTVGNGPFTLGATASSGLPVSYTSSDLGVATVSGTTVTIVGAGTTTIMAAQAGDANYLAATSVPQTLTVNKAAQTINFGALPSRTAGDGSFALPATASSGLVVSYTSSNPGVATVSGATVTIVGAGTTTIIAAQAGNANYLAATSVPQTLTVNKATQAITFGALASKTVGGGPFTLSATASSGLPVAYTSSNPGVATVAGATVTVVGAGTTTITASQSGNAVYLPAADVMQILTINMAPQINTPPASVAVCPGSAATLSVAASGIGTLTYQWSKGTTLLPGEIGRTLTIASVDATTVGSYSVVVSNDVGGTPSSAAVVSLNVPAAITTPPQPVTVTRGGQAVFTVAVTGTPTPSIQWYKGTTALPGQTGTTLTLNNVQAANAGDYKVQVTNACVMVESAAVALTVNGPVEITTPPASQTTCVGSDVMFTVLAAGTGPINIQWRSNGVAIAGATGGTLALHNVQTNFAANYDAVLTNVVNSATSSVAVLTVNFAPYLTQPPVGLTVIQGQADVSFSVVAAGKPTPTYQWRKDGVNIPNAINASYTIASAAATSAGNYDVVVSNSCGTTNSVAVPLVVNGPVTLTTLPRTQTANKGATVTFSVRAAGTPPFGYQWRFKGMNIPDATSADYTLTNVQLTNAGDYDVVVTNIVNSVTSTPVAVLTVLEGVRITPLASQTVLPGTSVTFAVAATGTAPLTYQWKKNGMAIPGATGASYTINSASTNDVAVYSVVVSNIVGPVPSNEATLAVVLRQLKVGDVQVTGATVGSPVSVPITLVGDGTERKVSLSVAFDPAVVTFTAVNGAPAGATLTVNNPGGNSPIGVTVQMPDGQMFPAGASEVARLVFAAASASQVACALVLGDTPVARQVLDAAGATLPSEFANGSVTLKTPVSPVVADATGLLGETVAVSTPPGGGGGGFVRVLVYDLGADRLGNAIRLQNAAGTTAAGIPYVLVPAPVPGTAVNLALEYYVSDRTTVPTPRLVVETTAAGLPAVAGDAMALEAQGQRGFVNGDNGGFYLNFRTEAGRTYYVQYRDDVAGAWLTSFPAVPGNGGFVLWIDTGPPRTRSLPTPSSTPRFYRIIRVQ